MHRCFTFYYHENWKQWIKYFFRKNIIYLLKPSLSYICKLHRNSFFVCIASKFHVKYQWEILRLIMVVINLSMFNNVTHTLHSHHAPHCHHSYCSRVLHWRLFPGLCQTDDCRCMTFTEGEDGSRNQNSSTLSAQGKTFMTKKAKGRKKKTEP